jgi:hypothetical protein
VILLALALTKVVSTMSHTLLTSQGNPLRYRKRKPMLRTITIVEPDADFEHREKYYFVQSDVFNNTWTCLRKGKGFDFRNIAEPWTWEGILKKIEEARENNWNIYEESSYD